MCNRNILKLCYDKYLRKRKKKGKKKLLSIYFLFIFFPPLFFNHFLLFWDLFFVYSCSHLLVYLSLMFYLPSAGIEWGGITYCKDRFLFHSMIQVMLLYNFDVSWLLFCKCKKPSQVYIKCVHTWFAVHTVLHFFSSSFWRISLFRVITNSRDYV